MKLDCDEVLVKEENGRESLQDLMPIIKTEKIKVEVKDEIEIFEEAIEYKTEYQSADVSDAHISNNQEFSCSFIETRPVEEPPGTTVECYSEENDRVKSDSIPSDSDMAETYLSARVLVCKLCNVFSTDCKCQQHCDALYLSAGHEDHTGKLHNSSSPKCSDRDLIPHISMHKQKQTHSVNMSGRFLCSKGNLILHEIHSLVHIFSCDFCSKSFRRESDLIMHIRTHFGERPFSCHLCSKSFCEKRILVKHIRTHSGERPFSCNFCSKSFSEKSSLVRHIRTHSGERPFCCDLCSKSFSEKIILVKHIRTHSGERPFCCDFCSKSFSEKDTLVNHIRTHSGERPFSCDFCSKSFKLKCTLTRHSRTHSGERPFSCDLCSKSFIQKSGLNTHHIRIHSGKHSYRY